MPVENPPGVRVDFGNETASLIEKETGFVARLRAFGLPAVSVDPS